MSDWRAAIDAFERAHPDDFSSRRVSFDNPKLIVEPPAPEPRPGFIPRQPTKPPAGNGCGLPLFACFLLLIPGLNILGVILLIGLILEGLPPIDVRVVD